MAKTSENYRGIHEKFDAIITELSIVLEPNYEEEEDYRERLIDCYGKVSEMKNLLENSVKNLKTDRIKAGYEKEFKEIYIWQEEINRRLKNDL